MDKRKLLKKTVITAFVHFLCALVFFQKNRIIQDCGKELRRWRKMPGNDAG